MKTSEIYAYHFRRMWAERNDDRVFVFANGHEYGRAERRASIRQNIGCQRRAKEVERKAALQSSDGL